MIRFVPKDRVEETHGERMVAAANLRTMRRKEPNRKAAMAQIRKEAPKKQRSSTELEVDGIPISEKKHSKGKKTELIGNQPKLDVNGNGKLDDKDFKLLRQQRSSTELDRIGVALMEGFGQYQKGRFKDARKEAKGERIPGRRAGTKIGDARRNRREGAAQKLKGLRKYRQGEGPAAERHRASQKFESLDQFGISVLESLDRMLTELKASTLQSYHQKRAAQLRMMPGTDKPKDFKKGWKGVKKAEEKLKGMGAKVPEIPSRKDAGTPKPKDKK